MNTSFEWLATRAAPVLGAALIALAWADGRDGGAGIPAVGGPEALRRELRLAQARALPVKAGPVTVDAGLRVYTGEEGADALALAEGLVPVAGAGGADVWPVTLYEDGETRETVFLNADGQEAGRLPPPDGYDPGWPLEAAFPGGVPDGVDQEGYDPAAVALTVWLSLPEGSDVLDAGGQSRAAGRGEASGSGLAATPEPAQKAEAGEAHANDCDARHSAGDGMPDGWETAHGLNPGLNDAALDADGDGVSNSQEYMRGTDPNDAAGKNRIIYVDSDAGSAVHDGFCQTVLSAASGPKATVQQAVDIAVSGDTIELRGQSAFSDVVLSPGDKDLFLRPVDDVRF